MSPDNINAGTEETLIALEGLEGVTDLIEVPDDYRLIDEELDQIQAMGLDDTRIDEAIERVRRKISTCNGSELSGGNIGPEPMHEPKMRFVDFMIVEPGEISSPMEIGNGDSPAKFLSFPRTEIIFDVLRELGVDFAGCEHVFGISPEDFGRPVWRKLPYTAIVIPSLNRTILVCDENENATFIIFTSADADSFLKMKKSELRDLKGQGKGDLVNWQKSQEGWKKNISDLLLHESSPAPKRETKTNLTKTILIDGNAVEVEEVDGCLLVPDNLCNLPVEVEVDGVNLCLNAFRNFCRTNKIQGKYYKLLKLLDDANVKPVEGIKFKTIRGMVYPAYMNADLQRLIPILVDEDGVAIYVDQEGVSREAVQVGKYSRHLKMGYATLETIIRDAGINKITGINFMYSDGMYPKEEVDEAISNIPYVDATTGICDFRLESGEVVQLVGISSYHKASGGNVPACYQSLKAYVEARLTPYEEMRIHVKNKRGYVRPVDVYLKSEVDALIAELWPQ